MSDLVKIYWEDSLECPICGSWEVASGQRSGAEKMLIHMYVRHSLWPCVVGSRRPCCGSEVDLWDRDSEHVQQCQTWEEFCSLMILLDMGRMS